VGGRLSLALGILATGLAGSGCDDLLTCREDVREIDIHVREEGDPDPLLIWVEFREGDGNTGHRECAIWNLRVYPLPAEEVTAVWLRARTPENPGVRLYELPLGGVRPETGNPYGVITETGTCQPYNGLASFDDLWHHAERGSIYLEIVLAGGAAPIAIGPLEPDLVTRDDMPCST